MLTWATFGLTGSEEFVLTWGMVVPLSYLIALVALLIAFRRECSRVLVCGLAAMPVFGDIVTLSWMESDLPNFGKGVIGGSALLALVAVVVSMIVSRKWQPERAVIRSVDRQAAEWWARQMKAQTVKQDEWRPDARRAA